MELLAFFSPGPMEMLILGVIAVLLFGKRLPEVGRSLGKGLMEFKRGLNEIEREIQSAGEVGSLSSSHDLGYDGSSQSSPDDYTESTAPKFEPPPAESAGPSSQPTSPAQAGSESSASPQ